MGNNSEMDLKSLAAELRHIFSNQDRIEKDHVRLDDKLNSFMLSTSTEIATLKGKSGIYGFFGGVFTVLLALGLALAKWFLVKP